MKQQRPYSPPLIVERTPYESQVDLLFKASHKANCEEFKRLFFIKARELVRKRIYDGYEKNSHHLTRRSA